MARPDLIRDLLVPGDQLPVAFLISFLDGAKEFDLSGGRPGGVDLRLPRLLLSFPPFLLDLGERCNGVFAVEDLVRAEAG